IRVAVMMTNRALRGSQKLACEFLTNSMLPVVTQPSEALERHSAKRLGRGVLRKDRRCSLRGQVLHVAREFRESEIHQPMELPDPITEVLLQTIAKPNELSKLFEIGIRQAGHCRTLLASEPSNAQRVDRVGLRPLQILLGKATSTKWIEQRHTEASSYQ